MELINKIIEYFKKIIFTQNKKKLIENAVILAIIGIIIIIAGSTFFGKSNNKVDTQPAVSNQSVAAASNSTSIDSSDQIEKQIEKILSQIAGAGKVTVMMTYATGKEIVPATDTKDTGNETQEKDTQGGTRTINENSSESSIVYEESQGGTKKPIIIKEILPQVKGVVVVADGAGDVSVRDNLIIAVQALVDIPIYKIQVFSREK